MTLYSGPGVTPMASKLTTETPILMAALAEGSHSTIPEVERMFERDSGLTVAGFVIDFIDLTE